MSEPAITKAALAIGYLKELDPDKCAVSIEWLLPTIDIIAEGWAALVRVAAGEDS